MKPVLVALALLLPTTALAQNAPPSLPPGWITTSNQSCKVWNPEPQPKETVTWSGGCKDGLAVGQGKLEWFVDGKPDAIFEGVYNTGKRNGPGVIIMPDGRRQQGMWIDDKPLRSRGPAI